MFVKSLHVTEYDATGFNRRLVVTNDPTWEQIEAAIRRLDRFRFPYVWLYPVADADPRDVPAFEVMGGKRAYVVCGNVGGYFQRRFLNPDAEDDEEVQVWRSDQGCEQPAKHVLRDLETVLRVTRHFCETGEYDPSIRWDDGLPKLPD